MVAGGGGVSLAHQDLPEIRVCQASPAPQGRVAPQETEESRGCGDHQEARESKEFKGPRVSPVPQVLLASQEQWDLLARKETMEIGVSLAP